MKKLFGVLLFALLSTCVFANEYSDCEEEAAGAVAFIEESGDCLTYLEYNYMYNLFYDFCENF